MIYSRCGLCCSQIKHLENDCDCNCKGCTNIENPFWGVCDIKNCCEQKGFEHCGLCPEMPCDKLSDYANYDNPPGARIEQLKKWCEQ